MIRRKRIGCWLILALVLFPQFLFAQEKGVIKPLIYGEFDKLQLLPPATWLMEGKPISALERELLQVSYLRGLYDAIQLSNVGWASIYSVLINLGGMNLAQLRDEVNQFYRDHPEMKDTPPAIVVLEILPEIRRRIPSGKTK
jgi:hypothetical protein